MEKYTGRIYKLSGNNHFYYGSTFNSLETRLFAHKHHAKNATSLVYLFFDSIGWENVSIEQVNEILCDTYGELLLEENKYILEHYNNPLCLNTHLAVRTPTFKPTINKKLSSQQKQDYKDMINNRINQKKALRLSAKKYQYYSTSHTGERSIVPVICNNGSIINKIVYS